MAKSKAQKINDNIGILRKEMNTLYDELHECQDKCKHKRAIKVGGGADTGNWDKSQDCYWHDFKCPTCLKEWREYR